LDQFLAILHFVAPGFVALKFFSWFGQPYRRTDLELTIWGVIAAWALTTAVSRVGVTDPDLALLIAVAGGALLGFVAGKFWRFLAAQSEWFRVGAAGRVWDWVFDRHSYGGQTPYVEVWTTSGHKVLGWVRSWAVEAQAQELDLYLRDPMWLNEAANEFVPMDGITGILIMASEIEMVRVFTPPAPDADLRTSAGGDAAD
jgi:Family of unknown function (DUF6338)